MDKKIDEFFYEAYASSNNRDDVTRTEARNKLKEIQKSRQHDISDSPYLAKLVSQSQQDLIKQIRKEIEGLLNKHQAPLTIDDYVGLFYDLRVLLDSLPSLQVEDEK